MNLLEFILNEEQKEKINKANEEFIESLIKRLKEKQNKNKEVER